MLLNWSWTILLFIVLPLSTLFCIKFYEALCIANVRDTKTRKAIKNRLTIFQSILLLIRDQDIPLSEKLQKVAKSFDYEPFVFFIKGLYPSVVFSSSTAAKTILINRWKNFEKNRTLLNAQQRNFVGNTLVLMKHSPSVDEVDEWHLNRMVLNPAFQHVEKYWDSYARKTSQCVSNIELYGSPLHYQNANKTYQIKVKDIMTRMTLDVIGECALKTQFNYLEPFDMNRVEKYEKLLRAFRFLIKNIGSWERNLLGPIYALLPLKENKELQQSFDTMQDFIHSLVEEKRQLQLEAQNRKKDAPVYEFPPEDESIGEFPTSIDLLLENYYGDTKSEVKSQVPKAGLAESSEAASSVDETPILEEKISFDNLCNDIFLLFVAGHATTSEALTLLLILLAQNEDVQNKLIDEMQHSFFGSKFKKNEQRHDCESIIQSMEDLHRLNTDLPYLDAVINENMRLYPPVGLLNRMCHNGSQVVDDIKVPSDYSVSLSVKSIHILPDIWGADCEKFNPDRWLKANKQHHELSTTQHEEGQQITSQSSSGSAATTSLSPLARCAYLPFGLGSRACLGSKFSLLEQKVFLVHLLSKFKVSLPDEMKKEKFKVRFMGTSPLMSVRDDTELKFTERFVAPPESITQSEEELIY